MGTRYKHPESKPLRQPPQNVRVKKLARPLRPDLAASKALGAIKVEGREMSIANVVSSEEKQKRADSTSAETLNRRCGTEEDSRPRNTPQPGKKSIADGSTAAESSLGQSDDALCPLIGGKQPLAHLAPQPNIEAQVAKRQSQRAYREQLQEQIADRQTRIGEANRSFGIFGNGIHRGQRRLPSEVYH